MTLSNEINNLPAAVGEGSAGHLGNHRVIHEALKVHDADIQAAMTSADTASTTVRDVEARVSSVEAVAGLSPESPVDGQTANLVAQSDTLTSAAVGTVVRSVVYDVAPTGNLEGDKSAVIAAALAAKNAGRMEVKMAPGHYRLDGVTVDDIHDRYLVGDGVTFTPESHVYPFRIGEIAARSVESPMEGGRGAIAFEVDDSQDSHWNSLFPLAKELGVPFGSAWHTRIAPWMKEAVRHGWEAVSHLPYDVDATSIPLSELEDLAVETVDALEEATGTREGHGFIYPRHLRNYETDRVLSKYFTRGRAGNDRMPRPMDAPNPWGYQCFDFDGHFTGGVMSNELKGILDSVAASNSKMVFFSHWRQEQIGHLAPGFREMIAYARNLGIAIKTPKQLMTRSQIIPDPYNRRGGFKKIGSTGLIDTTTSYGGGASGKAWTGNVCVMESERVWIAPRPGTFTVLRASVRIKAAGAAASSATQGVRFAVQIFSRDEHGQLAKGTVTTLLPPLLPGPTIPDQEWKRYRATFVITPGTQGIIPRWVAQNITAGELWMDEFQIDVIDHIPEFVVEARTGYTDGTTARATSFMATDLRGLAYRIEKVDPIVGELSLTFGADSLSVTSTNPADANKRFRVVFSPNQDHMAKAWSTEGA